MKCDRCGREVNITCGGLCEPCTAADRATPSWTTDPPTEPGWYWLYRKTAYDKMQIVQASRGGRGKLDILFTGYDEPSDPGRYPGALWSGPLRPPEEPD